MAVSPSSRRHHATSPTPRPLSSDPISPVTHPPIPQGPCNWRDLEQGRHASVCGCRRFWARDGGIEPQNHAYNPKRFPGAVDRLWCFCGHHACYHQEEQASWTSKPSQRETHQHELYTSHTMPPPLNAQYKHPSNSPARVTGKSRHEQQHDTSHRSYRHESVPRQSPSASRIRSPRHHSPASQKSRQGRRSAPSGLGLYIEQTRNQPFAERLSAAAQFAADQLPPTRSPSYRASEAGTQQSEAIRASPARIFSDHINGTRPQPLGLHIPQMPTMAGVNSDELVQSATEFATPSNAGTPALRGADDALEQIKTGVDDLHKDIAQLHGSPPLVCSGPGHTTEITQQDARESQKSNGHGQLQTANNDSARPEPQSPKIATLISHVATLRNILANTPNLGVSLASLGQRVDALETASFAHSSIEELNDRFEQFDGRIIEIESRVDELEKFRRDAADSTDSYNQNESSLLSRRDPTRKTESQRRHMDHEISDSGQTPLVNLGTTRSTTSIKGAAIERLQNIEKRLAELDAVTDKSVFRPCAVEVIFLPWGQSLKGIWHEPSVASQASASVIQGSTTLTHTTRHSDIYQNTLRDASNYTQHDLHASLPTDEWPHFTLAPKAIGPTSGISGRVYERLRSRGFVRNVIFNEGSARDVYSTICTAFGDLLTTFTKQASHDRMAKHRHTGADPESFDGFLALKGAFVPLRKVHKHSRLRFLSEAELATPALWTVSFLDSSVFMKAPSAGITRLFITNPAAYLQGTGEIRWTWQKIRELPRVPEIELNEGELAKSSFQSNGVDEADAREPCWELDPKLDPPASQQSSFTSNNSLFHGTASFESSHHPSPPQTKPDEANEVDEPADVSEESSEAEFDDLSDGIDSQQPLTHLVPITPVSDFPSSSRSRIAQHRTASLPISEPAFSSSVPHITVLEQPHPKRQVASFDNVISSVIPEASGPSSRPLSALSKRRRLSRTPSGRELNIDQDNPWALTPGRSHPPGSSMHDDVEPVAQEQQVQNKITIKDRGQSAYATPYSWSVHGKAGGVNDTDADMSDSSSSEDGDYEGNSHGEEESDDGDPDFADEAHPSIESEMEMDHAVMLDEEAWEGVGDDDEEMASVKSKRKRVGRNRKKTGPGRKISLSNMDVDPDQDDADDSMEAEEQDDDYDVDGSGDEEEENAEDGNDELDDSDDDDDEQMGN